MTFPADLTLVTVTCQADLLPDGGAAGSVTIAYDGQLTGSSVVPYVEETGTFNASGTCTIEVPATNDPQWTPQDFSYTVTLIAGGRKRTGTLQLNYQDTAVDLHDLVQWDGAAVAGTTYATLAQLTAHTSDTTGVHGITDTSALVVTTDSRLSDARTPTAHASTHASAGSDPVTLAGSQIGSGTVAYARLPVGTSASTIAAGDDSRLLAAYSGNWRALDHGLVGWSIDPAEIQGGTILPTAGLLQVVRVRPLSGVVNSIEMYVTAGGTSLTSGQCLAAVFNGAGALLGAGAVTGSLHGTGSGGWGDAGAKSLPLTVGQAVTPYADYLVGFYANTSGTLPTFARAANVSHGAALNMGMSAPTFRFSSADSSLTTAMPLNIGSQTAIGTAWVVGLK